MRWAVVSGFENNREMSPPAMSKPSPSTLQNYPRTLRDSRERLVGLIDGYPNYYHQRHHRIDVLLHESDGSRYLSEYYRLRPDETVREYVTQARRNGYDCDVLPQWEPRPDTHSPRSLIPRQFRRWVGKVGRFTRRTRSTGKDR